MKKKLIYLLTLTLGFSVSCQKDLLSPESQTAVATNDDAQFTTALRIEQQVRGIYSALKAGNMYGARYIIYNEVRADNWLNQNTNSVTATQTWNHSLGNGAQEVTGLWDSGYTIINRCNLFIEGMGRTGTAVVGAATAANYIAEAKFVRAVAYYNLLQLYARPYWDGNGAKPGVPLRLTGNSVAGNYDIARSTVAQVYTQVLKDLNEAETGLPLTYLTTAATPVADPLKNTTRAHRNTAIAFKTRVYLSMRDYANVITEANKIVSTAAPFTATTGVAHALAPVYTDLFKTPFTASESILSMPFVLSQDAGANQSTPGSYFWTVKLYSLNPAGIIGNAGWKTTDTRRSLIANTAGLPYHSKYAVNAVNGYADYIPVIRYAEVLLSLSEALTRSTNTVSQRAVDLLNAVRRRSDATTTFTVAGFATPAALNDAILTERNIEFLGEGLRWPDLARLGLTIPAKGAVEAIPETDRRYIWPISGVELLYNKQMVDN